APVQDRLQLRASDAAPPAAVDHAGPAGRAVSRSRTLGTPPGPVVERLAGAESSERALARLAGGRWRRCRGGARRRPCSPHHGGAERLRAGIDGAPLPACAASYRPKARFARAPSALCIYALASCSSRVFHCNLLDSAWLSLGLPIDVLPKLNGAE